MYISYICRNQGKIEFRDATNLFAVIFTYSISPQKPFYQSAVSTSLLAYEDWAGDDHVVRLLSCSSLALIPTATINIGKDLVRDICFVQHGDKELLVVNRNLDNVCEIQAYSTATSTLEWRVRGRLPGMGADVDPLGITTDGLGHLFVCDGANRCIFVLSADGKFVAILMREGEQNLGEPRKIRWCNASESLVVSNKRDEKWNVSIVNVKRNE